MKIFASESSLPEDSMVGSFGTTDSPIDSKDPRFNRSSNSGLLPVMGNPTSLKRFWIVCLLDFSLMSPVF